MRAGTYINQFEQINQTKQHNENDTIQIFRIEKQKPELKKETKTMVHNYCALPPASPTKQLREQLVFKNLGKPTDNLKKFTSKHYM